MRTPPLRTIVRISSNALFDLLAKKELVHSHLKKIGYPFSQSKTWCLPAIFNGIYVIRSDSKNLPQGRLRVAKPLPQLFKPGIFNFITSE